VELTGYNGVLDKEFEGDNLEGIFVGGFEDDRASSAGLLNLEPARGTDTPAVSRLKAGEAKLRHRSAEIIAEGFGGFEEGSVDDAADGVDAVVVGAGFATAGTVEASHWLATTDVEGLTEDVFAAVLDGFYGGHQVPLFFQYPTCGQGTATSSAKIFFPFERRVSLRGSSRSRLRRRRRGGRKSFFHGGVWRRRTADCGLAPSPHLQEPLLVKGSGEPRDENGNPSGDDETDKPLLQEVPQCQV
jgi:hypothetical protein